MYRSYDPHRSRDSLSPVCGIFSYWCQIVMLEQLTIFCIRARAAVIIAITSITSALNSSTAPNTSSHCDHWDNIPYNLKYCTKNMQSRWLLNFWLIIPQACNTPKTQSFKIIKKFSPWFTYAFSYCDNSSMFILTFLKTFVASLSTSWNYCWCPCCQSQRTASHYLYKVKIYKKNSSITGNYIVSVQN